MTRAAWVPAYVGLGSNIENPSERLDAAFAALAAIPDTRLEARSSIYRSQPMGPQDQPDFLNAVAVLLTRLEPGALLTRLQAIEQAEGRSRTGQRWGPRSLDLDLLVFGNRVIDEPRLTVPHPGIPARNFVLFPLEELAPNLVVPGLGEVAGLRRALGDEAGRIERLESRPSA